jgi:hypothetical protein
VVFVLLFNDTTSWWLASFSGKLLSWRVYWALPIPALIACSAVAAVAIAVRDRSIVARSVAALAVAALGVGFFTSGRWTYDEGNRASLQFAVWKVPETEYRVARRVVELSEPESVALVAPGVALRLTAFPDAPRLVAVRSGYLRHLKRHLGRRESDARIKLFALPTGKKKLGELGWYLDQIEERCIDIMVTNSTSEKLNPTLRAELERRGFVREKDARYVIWSRDRARCGQAPDDTVDVAAPASRRKAKRKARVRGREPDVGAPVELTDEQIDALPDDVDPELQDDP